MPYFCNFIPTNTCNPRVALQEIVDMLCSAFCSTESPILLCDPEAPAPANTANFEDIWANCPDLYGNGMRVPYGAVVSYYCGGTVFQWYNSNAGGLEPPEFPIWTFVSQKLTRVVPCGTGTGSFSAQFPFAAPEIGSMVVVQCNAPQNDQLYFFDGTNWRRIDDVTSRYVGTSSVAGLFSTSSTTGVAPSVTGMANPVVIPVPNVPQNYGLFACIGGYHNRTLCNGFVAYLVNTVEVKRTFMTTTNGGLQSMGNTEMIAVMPNNGGNVTVEFRLGRDTTLNACASGTTAEWNNFVLHYWIEPLNAQVL